MVALMTGSFLQAVRAFLQVGATLTLVACASARRVNTELREDRGALGDRPVVVMSLDGVRAVRQEAPDSCWAACLEQALALQGVDITQSQLLKMVYPDAETRNDRSLSLFWWHQHLAITEQRLLDGAVVWCRCDIDGHALAPILLSETMAKKLTYELSKRRIPVIGVTTKDGSAHMLSVVGAAFPDNAEPRTWNTVIGFLLYDPMTTRKSLVSTETLFKHFAGLVYVTTYDGGLAAAFGHMESAMYK